ncbi:hypothetical protein [Demequina gelatinilytica]|uniref:hypothetical protein n=1 Tax=Demequina gelatinilytica TaxID=1638980 RepID=UPI00078675F9|nr:hypothetical protein [Demequina gelatinilytica]
MSDPITAEVDALLDLHQCSDEYDLDMGNGVTAKSCTSCTTTMWPCPSHDRAVAIRAILDRTAPSGGEGVTLEDRYRVTRRDGRDAPGEKHHGCRYFVLDLTHDPKAPELLDAYFDRTAASEDPPLPGCTGDYNCPAPAHQHGCFSDTQGHCNDPGDHNHAAPSEDEREALVQALRRDAGDYARHMRGETGQLSWDQRDVRAWEAAGVLAALTANHRPTANHPATCACGWEFPCATVRIIRGGRA